MQAFSTLTAIHRRAFFLKFVLALMLTLAGPTKASGLLYQLPYRWTDSEGQALKFADLHGKPVVLTMAYGACRKICSTSIFKMQQMQAIADRNGVAIQFVVVALDPSKDRPEDLRQFRQDRKLLRENWKFLSGSAADVRDLAAILGINYWIYHDHVLHDFGINARSRRSFSLASFPVRRSALFQMVQR